MRAVRVLEDLVARLLSGIGSEYSLSRIAEMPGQGSVHMVRKYIGYLEEAFIVFSVPRFSWKVREQIASNKKAYADTSFLASLYLDGDANHTVAARIVATATVALRLPLTPFGKAELLNVLMRMEHKGKMHAAETQACMTYVAQDIASDVLEESSLRLDEWMTRTHDTIKSITPLTGTRTLDAMHIALAKIHGADTILSFDKNQRLAAKAAGFSLLPVSL